MQQFVHWAQKEGNTERTGDAGEAATSAVKGRR
jgi:hypothetical protein